ncbi:hypothetical protein PGLA_09030 [Paenibacillus glacialis]|uniref:Uncharacterized protein n=1 Tax=Paenibacillus glacialis TaxID=494026 RepID=A0A168LGX3_9BACL|nr:hypothetical protein PGLA_09030 [Paenibacillus glacialis]
MPSFFKDGTRFSGNIRNRVSRINFIITQIDLDASAIMKLIQVKLILSYIFKNTINKLIKGVEL